MQTTTFLLALFLTTVAVLQCEATCPFPPKICKKCVWKCEEGEKLEFSLCGCCYNKCVPDEDYTYIPTEPTTTTTTENPCADEVCPEEKCCDDAILAAGQKCRGCCPGCVVPKIGDKCYKDLDGKATCGKKLKCFLGRCLLKLIGK